MTCLRHEGPCLCPGDPEAAEITRSLILNGQLAVVLDAAGQPTVVPPFRVRATGPRSHS